jgi:hypothetical protein
VLAAADISYTTPKMEGVRGSDNIDHVQGTEQQGTIQKQNNLEQTKEDDDSFQSGNVSQSSPSTNADMQRNKGNNHDNSMNFDVARKENQALGIGKTVVIIAMILITIGASVAIFIYVDSKEHENFEENLQDDALKLFSDIGKNIIQRFAQLDSLAIAMVSYANVSGNDDWPFVTIPNHAVHASKARTTTGAVAIENFHYIQLQDSEGTETKNSTRKGWEQYTREQGSQWVNQALAVQEEDDSYFGASLPDNEVAVEHSDIWYGNDVVPESTGP